MTAHQFRHHSHISLHFTINAEIGAGALDNLGRFVDFGRLGVGGAAKVGEAEHGNVRVNVKLFRQVGGIEGDGRQLLGGWLDDHGGVGEEVDAILHQHQVDAAHPAPRLRAHGLQSRSQHFGIVIGQTGDKGVGFPLIDHHGAIVVGLAHNLLSEG